MDLDHLACIGIPVPKTSAQLVPPEVAGWDALCAEAKAVKAVVSRAEGPAAAGPAAGPAAASPPAGHAAAGPPAPARAGKNFLQEIIERDLAPGGRWAERRGKKGDVIRTRFPPEPNGYLHIGHAKSFLINFGLAEQYGGRCHLRFDDTNPAKEETEYVNSIQEDVKWMGCDWGEHLCFASDYFDQMYEWAEHLITKGLAYVDSQTPDDMKKNRGNVVTPGVNSPFRDRTPEENMRLFHEMRDRKHKEGSHVLRAKIDMAHPNMNMRDMPIYRILHKAHHRTGNKWCIYPLYDYAHGEEDAIEGITHSICTLEFEGHRQLYEWFHENLPIEKPPKQYEFARLNLTNTVMSKRKLLKLVKAKAVDGWDDPRMPTICGMRRRGVTPASLRAFVGKIGVTTSNSLIDVNLLEKTIREDLDPACQRRMVVLEPLKVVIEDFPAGKVEEVEAMNHPSKPEMGVRRLKFTREIWIERDDFREDAPETYFRLRPGGEVKLRYSYVIKVKDVVKNAKGEVVELRCTHDPATRDDMPSDRKVKGVIHWVSSAHCVTPSAVRLYDYLLKTGIPGEDAAPAEEEDEDDDEADDKDDGWMKELNPDSLIEIGNAKMEESLAKVGPGERFQFERNAFFAVDQYAKPGKLVFNRIVGLKESGLKKEEDSRAAARSRKDVQAKQLAEKEAKKSLDPRDMFRSQADLYSKFDEDGVPTHNAAGEPLPKSNIKKLRKDWEKQKKLFEG